MQHRLKKKVATRRDEKETLWIEWDRSFSEMKI